MRLRGGEGRHRVAAIGIAGCLLLVAAGVQRISLGASRALGPRDYVAWVRGPESGLRVGQRIGSIELTLQYTPREYMALLELGTEATSPSAVESVTTELGELEYCRLMTSGASSASAHRVVGPKALGYPDEWSSRVLRQDALRLVAGADTLRCVLIHCEASGLTTGQSYVCGFARTGHPDGGGQASSSRPRGKKLSGARTLLLDGGALGVGPLALQVSAHAIGRIPKLQADR